MSPEGGGVGGWHLRTGDRSVSFLSSSVPYLSFYSLSIHYNIPIQQNSETN